MSDISLIGIKWTCAWGTSKPTTATPILSHLIAFSIFLATILEGLISKKPYDVVLKKACAIGAIVASKKGANPIIEDDEIKKLYAN